MKKRSLTKRLQILSQNVTCQEEQGLDTEFEDCVFQTEKKLDQVAFLISKACLKNKRKPV